MAICSSGSCRISFRKRRWIDADTRDRKYSHVDSIGALRGLPHTGLFRDFVRERADSATPRRSSEQSFGSCGRQLVAPGRGNSGIGQRYRRPRQGQHAGDLDVGPDLRTGNTTSRTPAAKCFCQLLIWRSSPANVLDLKSRTSRNSARNSSLPESSGTLDRKCLNCSAGFKWLTTRDGTSHSMRISQNSFRSVFRGSRRVYIDLIWTPFLPRLSGLVRG